MTLHRLTKDQLIIEDCRRQQQIPFTGIHEPNDLWEEKRSTTHDYSKKWVRFWMATSPEPQDRIVMLEDYAERVLDGIYQSGPHKGRQDMKSDLIVKSKGSLHDFYPVSWPDNASTLPESLDSHCKQYVVKQVLGVEGKVLLQPKNGESGLCNPRTPETVFYFFGIAEEVEG